MSCQEIYGLEHHVFQNREKRKTLKDLAQGDVVYIEYFHIEILIYFSKKKTVDVPWQKRVFFFPFFFLNHFYIARGFVSFTFLAFSK